jgi:hypothetical protein
MERGQIVVKVFDAFMTLPDAQQRVNSQKPIEANVFLTNPVVANAIFSNEPGCAVNYQAIKEKIKVLEPHLRVTQSGPTLMQYFDDLRKQRNLWAVALANYESHTIMTYTMEQKLYGRGLTASERDALNANRPELPVVSNLNAAEQRLIDTKTSREFSRHVYILEECIKQHKLHLQRKAHAVKAKRALARKKQTQARKAKKAALTSSVISRQPKRTKSAFNPDLPEFTQFVNGYTTTTTAAASGLAERTTQSINGCATNVIPAANRLAEKIAQSINGCATNVLPAASGLAEKTTQHISNSTAESSNVASKGQPRSQNMEKAPPLRPIIGFATAETCVSGDGNFPAPPEGYAIELPAKYSEEELDMYCCSRKRTLPYHYVPLQSTDETLSASEISDFSNGDQCVGLDTTLSPPAPEMYDVGNAVPNGGLDTTLSLPASEMFEVGNAIANTALDSTLSFDTPPSDFGATEQVVATDIAACNAQAASTELAVPTEHDPTQPDPWGYTRCGLDGVVAPFQYTEEDERYFAELFAA